MCKVSHSHMSSIIFSMPTIQHKAWVHSLRSVLFDFDPANSLKVFCQPQFPYTNPGTKSLWGKVTRWDSLQQLLPHVPASPFVLWDICWIHLPEIHQARWSVGATGTFWGPRKNYFTSSDPHHDMLGGGCQVRVVIENMMGNMENLRTLISGFLGLVILVRWALATMFLSWTTQTGCRIHRTYVSLIGSGEGRHTTHLLECVPLLSTSQTDWKQSSDVLADISFDILSDISSDIFFWYIFWHSFWHIFWHSFWHLSDISFDILSDKSFDTLSDISSDILSDISFDMLSDISSDILSDISKPKPNIHSFTKKAALQTLYLPRTTQQK